jgi:hypothetical protein
VQEVRADGTIAQLTTDATSKWYYVEDETLRQNVDIIYRANQASDDALALFHLVVASEDDAENSWFDTVAAGDYIKLAGTDVPTGTNTTSLVKINVGVPDEDNGALFDVVIPVGELGTGSTSYTYTWIVVNNGAYLDVNANQILGSPGLASGGNFENGTVRVANGGKVRDSAWMGWPLGSNSAFRVLYGGSIAVGKGDRDGHAWLDGYTALYPAEYPNFGSFEGWLIAPSGDNTKAVWGSRGSSSEEDGYGFLDAFDTNVVIYGNVTIKKSTGLIYDVLLVAGTTLTIETDVDLDPKERVYGQPATSGAMLALGLTTALPASTIILNGTITEHLTGETSVFSSGGTGTYTVTGTTAPAGGLKPYTDTSIAFYTDWTK